MAKANQISLERVADFTSEMEGGAELDSVNRNKDGAGLSFGLINWSQKGGGLHILAVNMWILNEVAFMRIFGPYFHEMIQVLALKSLAPVGGAVLWEDPWVSRWMSTVDVPEFVAAQYACMRNGEYMIEAVKAASDCGMTSERSLALLFDRGVQQGPPTMRAAALAAARAGGSQAARQAAFVDIICPKAGRWESVARERCSEILRTARLSDSLAVS